MKRDWQGQFRQIILNRGFEYYLEGNVRDVTKEDFGYSATVEGTDIYNVEIHMDGKEVIGLECDCPYACDGHLCKHMAAVLFEIEERKDKESASIEDKETIDDILNAMSEDDLRKELREILKQEENYREGIYQRYRTRKSSVEDAGRFRMQLESLAYTYGDRYGYIDWNKGSAYVSAFNNLLDQYADQMLLRGENEIVLEVLKAAFYELNHVEMDGSSGEHSTIEEYIKDKWYILVGQAGDDLKDEMFAWFGKEKEKSSELICGDLLDGMYYFAFNDDRFIDVLLDEVRDQLLDPDLNGYSLEHYLFLYDDLLKKSGRATEEYETWLKDHEDKIEVMKIRLKQAEEKEDQRQIVYWLKQLVSTEEIEWKKEKYQVRLKDMYHTLNEEENEKELLVHLLKERRNADPEEIYRLKELCDDNEWKIYAQTVIDRYPLYRPAFLRREERYDELLEIIKGSSISVADEYLAVMKERYPEEMLKIYMNYVSKRIEENTGGKRIENIRHYLHIICSIPEGKKVPAVQLPLWYAAYPGRKAFRKMLVETVTEEGLVIDF